MISVLLASHGKMAEGMLNSTKLFFGDNIEKIQAVCLESNDDPSKFGERVKNAVDQLDDGSGVMIFVDLFGGTPSNQCAMLLGEDDYASRIQVLTGMSLPMVIEFLSLRNNLTRISEINIDSLIESAQKNVVDLNKMLL